MLVKTVKHLQQSNTGGLILFLTVSIILPIQYVLPSRKHKSNRYLFCDQDTRLPFKNSWRHFRKFHGLNAVLRPRAGSRTPSNRKCHLLARENEKRRSSRGNSDVALCQFLEEFTLRLSAPRNWTNLPLHAVLSSFCIVINKFPVPLTSCSPPPKVEHRFPTRNVQKKFCEVKYLPENSTI